MFESIAQRRYEESQTTIMRMESDYRDLLTKLDAAKHELEATRLLMADSRPDASIIVQCREQLEVQAQTIKDLRDLLGDALQRLGGEFPDFCKRAWRAYSASAPKEPTT